MQKVTQELSISPPCEKPVTAQLVAAFLSRQLVDPVPTPASHGHRLTDLTGQFDAKVAQIDAMPGE